MDLNRFWTEYTYVAFDTEASGSYPMEAELCEIAAIKWRAGQELDRFQTLIKPSKPLSDFITGIHGITNEMVSTAPVMADVIGDFHSFLKGCVPVAHHAPFDLGFLSLEFEKARLPLPEIPVLCTSLLSRQWIPESHNHKLQTLIQYLKLPQGQAHRALDDAKACLGVLLSCCNKAGLAGTLEFLIESQTHRLNWKNFSIQSLREDNLFWVLPTAIERQQPIELVYSGGSRPGQPRTIIARGIVRNPDGDYVVGVTPGYEDDEPKRYYFSRITSLKILSS